MRSKFNAGIAPCNATPCYCYSLFPNKSIVNFIKAYLVSYPNETDFWEILNKNLVTALLTETIPTNFGVEYNLEEIVDSLTVDIQVKSGSSLVNFPRASEVIGFPTSELPVDGFSPPLLDLQDITGLVTASFTVNREAAFDNFVGFYAVVNEDGGIDTTGDGIADLNPGDLGYTKAAVEALTDLALTTPNLRESLINAPSACTSFWAN